MKDGLRRRNYNVKNLNVSGQATGNINNPVMTNSNVWYVDGDIDASGDGTTWTEAFKTITEALAIVDNDDIVYVMAKKIEDYTGDPTSYAETLTIPFGAAGMALIGVSRGLTQGGLPQIKIGAGAVPMLKVQGPGCIIANIGFNGASSTGGGILLDDDYTTKSAFGTTIMGCHFKNCKVTTKHAETGGAIYTTSAGNAWQVTIVGNHFYKNEADIVLVGTSNTQPQDWLIADNLFSGPAANVDCNLYLAGGSGINGVVIDNNIFPCDPAIASGANAINCELTGCVGVYSRNMHGFTGLTLGDGTVTAGVIPTTVWMIDNYQEDAIITRTS